MMTFTEMAKTMHVYPKQYYKITMHPQIRIDLLKSIINKKVSCYYDYYGTMKNFIIEDANVLGHDNVYVEVGARGNTDFWITVYGMDYLICDTYSKEEYDAMNVWKTPPLMGLGVQRCEVPFLMDVANKRKRIWPELDLELLEYIEKYPVEHEYWTEGADPDHQGGNTHLRDMFTIVPNDKLKFQIIRKWYAPAWCRMVYDTEVLRNGHRICTDEDANSIELKVVADIAANKVLRQRAGIDYTDEQKSKVDILNWFVQKHQQRVIWTVRQKTPVCGDL